MSGLQMVFVIAIVTLTVVVPMIIAFHYTTKWKSLKGLSDEEQDAIEDLWKQSQRLNSRIAALETILDDKVPDWQDDRP